MRRETREERRDVQRCEEILSVQDLERVGGASGREGLRRVMPRAETANFSIHKRIKEGLVQYERPWRVGMSDV